LGERIALVDAAINASGQQQGGRILIGGDLQGQGSLPRADLTWIDSSATVQANALEPNQGGSIIAWANRALQVNGLLQAQGGLIETSSAGGFQINQIPDAGINGTWLIDPPSIEISNAFTDGIETESDGFFTFFNANPNSGFTTATLTIEDITDALTAGSNVIIQTPAGNTPGTGDIILNADLDYNGSGQASLSVVASGSIIINNPIFDSIATEGEDRLIVELIAARDIILRALIDTQGAEATLQAQGNINVVNDISTGGEQLNLVAEGSLATGDISSSGALVSLRSNSGSVTTGNIFTSGGDVDLQAATFVQTGNINTENIGSNSGNISVRAINSITTGNISANGSGGNAGNVFFDPISDIQVGFVNTESFGGTGGNVQFFTDRFFRAINGFISRDGQFSSISTIGDLGNGSVFIRHGGGALSEPFIVGPAATNNGTIASITTGSFTIDSANPANSFLSTFNLGNIDLITNGNGNGNNPFLDNCNIECQDEKLDDALIDEDDWDLEDEGDDPLLSVEPAADVDESFEDAESFFSDEFSDFLDLDESVEITDLPTAQAQLKAVQGQAGVTPALLYIVFGSNSIELNPKQLSVPNPGSRALRSENATDPLELLLVTPDAPPIYIQVPGVSRQKAIETAQNLRRQVSTPARIGTTTYLAPAQELYQWLIAPVANELTRLGITHLSFIMDAGLRSLPLAALHDGEQFLIERYSLGLMPSLSLTDLTYRDLRTVGALVGGASTFADQDGLPTVPLELASIQSTWNAQSLEENRFTLNNLINERRQNRYGIVHLATHGEFSTGTLSNSYIQLFDTKLRLDQIRTLGFANPPLDLITLSACQTALGNESAELGFAGFAVLAGAKTSVASLWSVSDAATTGLMVEFYQQLQRLPTKADALRSAQLAMLNGQIFIQANQLHWPDGSAPLPADPNLVLTSTAPDFTQPQDLSHPFYWAAYELVGSPW
jgi:CHAT domain-containing protein